MTFNVKKEPNHSTLSPTRRMKPFCDFRAVEIYDSSMTQIMRFLHADGFLHDHGSWSLEGPTGLVESCMRGILYVLYVPDTVYVWDILSPGYCISGVCV